MEDLLPDATLAIQMVIFLVVYGVLKSVLFDPYLDLLQRRDAQTVDAGEELDALQARIDSLQAKIDARLQEAQQEGRRQREAILAEAKAKADQILSQAQSEAQEKLATTAKELGNSRDDVHAEAARELDTLAAQAAAKLTGKAA